MPGEKRFPVIECFGPTLQGEGALIGRQTMFVRFGGCDYQCSWCDSLHAVLPEEVRKNSIWMTVKEIAEKLRSLSPDTPWITLSGGNPVLLDLAELVMELRHDERKIAVETQGTIFKDWLYACQVVSVSPKPPSSSMVTNWGQLDDYLQRLYWRAGCEMNFKVVVFDEADFQYAVQLRQRYIRYEKECPLYLQVGNRVGEDGTSNLLSKLDWLAKRAMEVRELRNAIVLPQLHVLLWGNKKGV